MEREVFARRLREAASAARDFARKLVFEPVPDAMKYRLRLNSSYDGNPLVGDEVIYPADSSLARAAEVHLCDEDQVIAELWRDGRVPEWINVSVLDVTATTSILQLICCGRFTASDDLLYHAHEGLPPFHILSPDYPSLSVEGRFSIFHSAECWSSADVERIRPHAPQITSLTLAGPAITDAVVASLPALPRLVALRLRGCAITGSGFPLLPALRNFSVELTPGTPFRLSAAPLSREHLSLATDGELLVDRGPRMLHSLDIRATRISGLALPRKLNSLSAHLSATTEQELATWLRRTKRITHLRLEGIRLSDAFAEMLPARFQLETLSLSDTGVSDAALRRIARAAPQLRLYPSPV